MIINIIGRGEGWEEGLTADGEKWGINYFSPELDILFDIHPRPDYRQLANAKVCNIRTLTQVNYPLKKVEERFKTLYFSSSIDYLIAYALLTETDLTGIHLYGITMDDPEHYAMKCGCDFWCGIAKGIGVDIIVHGCSTIMTTPSGLQYGTLKPIERG